MVTQKDIQATCDDIVREFAPLQVILFGSYAYGTPTEDSDVDLLVVMDIPESETSRQAAEIWQRIPSRFSMDLLVRSPQEIAYRISHNDWFLREITEKGEVLYGHLNFLEMPLKKEKCDMNPLTLEWIEKAEGDYTTVQLLQQSPISSKDVICFHAQQCIEKYLKAWLQEADILAPRTHRLEELLNLIVPIIPNWNSWHTDFSTLSKHAVDFRYPGKSATAENAEHAAKICNQVRQAIREALKLPQNQSERQV
ncbi:MAG: HEPN domain-containing protein [Candidatus Poribacteria bacterium]|nr:HEPN domain-containing protein [Candidatus Poribacteria bacterium]